MSSLWLRSRVYFRVSIVSFLVGAPNWRRLDITIAGGLLDALNCYDASASQFCQYRFDRPIIARPSEPELFKYPC
jgi:hypothetical protein